MGFVKKYIALIIPGLLVLLSLIFFVLTPVMAKSVKEGLDQSAKNASQVSRLAERVPPEKQWEQEKLYQDKFAQDVEEIEKMAVGSSLRSLISYNILPDPKDTSIQLFINFGDKYRQALEDMVESISARDAPTDIEIQNATTAGSASDMQRRSYSRDDRYDAIVDAVCLKRADEISVYANPDIFVWYNFWREYDYIGKDQAVLDVWYSQAAYWIYDDVIQAVKQMNSGSQKVASSPLKRLMGVSFSQPIITVSVSGSSRSNKNLEGDVPEYVLEDQQYSLLGVEPWTGRVTNENIDVLHFSIAVVVRADSVLEFIEDLCSRKTDTHRAGYKVDGEQSQTVHNQITVLKYSRVPIDREDQTHRLYRYGNDPVVRVNLICEYVFNKAGYDSIKPDAVKKILGDLEQEDSRSSRRSGRNRR